MKLDELAAAGLVERGRSLAGMTTYKFGGTADWYAEVGDMNHLAQVVGIVPTFVLGRGSNVVISEHGFRGLVVRLVGEFNEIAIAEGVATAGAGVPLPKLARACAAESCGGLEFYVGIPGSVGGAVVMNAGGHGSDTAEWLIDAAVLDTITGEITDRTPEDMELGYRRSNLSADDVVLRARYRTIQRSAGESETLMREITSWRRENQPGGTFNAGSVFKNPPGDAAGRIIDSLGLKGYRVGGVTVSERHANFFIADDDATAQDVYDLVMGIKRIVEERTGTMLVPEIRFIGEFGGEG